MTDAPILRRALPLLLGATVLVSGGLLSGCSAAPTGSDAAPAASDEATTGGETSGGDRPETLAADLPVPPGVLLTSTPDASGWEYIYGEVTTDEARAFAQQFEDLGYDLKGTVDSDGVEQWYFQNADWAVKLEETHATQELRYWVDPMS